MGKIIKKILHWLYWHTPIITTRSRRFIYAQLYNIELEKFLNKSNWSAINPVIHDLEKLRANTWDQDKITHIQDWLKVNFEVKDEDC